MTLVAREMMELAMLKQTVARALEANQDKIRVHIENVQEAGHTTGIETT